MAELDRLQEFSQSLMDNTVTVVVSSKMKDFHTNVKILINFEFFEILSVQDFEHSGFCFFGILLQCLKNFMEDVYFNLHCKNKFQ
jgi:hypothetical protein